MRERGWDKIILAEGRSERWIEILERESNSFGFFYGDGKRRLIMSRPLFILKQWLNNL